MANSNSFPPAVYFAPTSVPASFFQAVTPDDSASLPLSPCRALYVGVSGDVTVISTLDNTNTPVTFKSCAIGYHPISCRKVMATGTTATNIVALY